MTAELRSIQDKHTSNACAELDHVETGSTYRAAVRSLDPRLETVIVQIVATGKQMCYHVLILDGRYDHVLVLGIVLVSGWDISTILKGVDRERWYGGGRAVVSGDEIAEADYARLGHWCRVSK